MVMPDDVTADELSFTSAADLPPDVAAAAGLQPVAMAAGRDDDDDCAVWRCGAMTLAGILTGSKSPRGDSNHT